MLENIPSLEDKDIILLLAPSVIHVNRVYDNIYYSHTNYNTYIHFTSIDTIKEYEKLENY